MSAHNDDQPDPDEEYRSQQPANDDTVVEDQTRRLEDFVPENYRPLIAGESVDIDARLIGIAETALEVKLPGYDPQDDIIRPIADSFSDEAVKAHVTDRLHSQPLIAMMLFVAALLRTACKRGVIRIERQLARKLARQQALPLEIPRRKIGGSSWKGFVADLLLFWGNWSGLGFAGFSAALGSAAIVENVTQVVALHGGDWEQTKTWLGAFGFTWGFTIGTVGITRWRRSVYQDPHSDPQSQSLSKIGMVLAWGGLALLGFAISTVHVPEPEDSKLVVLLRCLMTTSMVLTLGIFCVAIEHFCEQKFHAAMSWIMIPTPEIEALETELLPPDLKLTTLQQCRKLAKAIVKRVKGHDRAETRRWLSRRDEFRKQNQVARDIDQKKNAISRLESELRQVQDSLNVIVTSPQSTPSSL